MFHFAEVGNFYTFFGIRIFICKKKTKRHDRSPFTPPSPMLLFYTMLNKGVAAFVFAHGWGVRTRKQRDGEIRVLKKKEKKKKREKKTITFSVLHY